MTDHNITMSSDNRQKQKEALLNILSSYSKESRFLLPILQDIQRTFRYLPVEAMKEVATYLDVPESRVYSVATFYKAFTLSPRGRKTIRVCEGTACHLRGGAFILNTLQKELSISSGETTPDGQFTLETVNCLGACALAPVVMVNEKVYGQMTPNLIPSMIEEEQNNDV